MLTELNRILGTLALIGLLCRTASAQFKNKSSVADGSGTIISGGEFTHISAAGQPGGITSAEGGGFVHQAGFLNTVFLKSGLDTDEDGLADEADPDNDGDGLADLAEISGSAFNPAAITGVNNADTDDDGLSDGQESVAGTDPTDSNVALKLLALTNSAGSRAVVWLARGNNQKVYVVRARTNLLFSESTVIFSNTVPGGLAPWFVVTNTVADVSVTHEEFYSVEVYP